MRNWFIAHFVVIIPLAIRGGRGTEEEGEGERDEKK